MNKTDQSDPVIGLHQPARSSALPPKFWPLFFGLSGLVLTACLTLILHVYQTDRLQVRFNSEVERVARDIERRFQMPIYGMMGARGVYAASGSVNREGFRRYVESRNLDKEFPGVRGFGFIERLERKELDAFVARERADDAPDFAVRTNGDAPDLYVIKFIEPLDRNRAARGFDVGGDAVRRAAAERAARSGQPALTEVIQLVRDQQSRPGFLLYVPVYKRGFALESEAQRMIALHGLVYASIVLEELMDPALELFQASGLYLRIKGMDALESGNSLYTAGQEPSAALLTQQVQLSLSGNFLLLEARSTPALEASTDRWLVAALGVAGLLLSCFLSWAIWLQVTARKRAEVQAGRMTADLKKLAYVARDTTNAVLMTDTAGRIEWANEGFTRITGFSLQEVLGQKPGDFLQCPQTDPVTVAQIRNALKSLQMFSGEILNRGKDGHQYWLELQIQPLFDNAGQHSGFMAIEIDVSERKRIETSLRLSEARMKALSELSSQWFWETDVDLRFTRFICGDPALLALLNQVALGRRRWEMGVEPLQITWEEHQKTLARRESFQDFEYCRFDESGKANYWSASGTPWYNEVGEFVGYIGTGSNISERKTSEIRIAQSEAMLDRTVKIAKVGAWRVDLKTGLPEWSAETCRIHEVPEGYTPSMEEALNFYAPQARPVITKLVNRGMESGEPWDVELPFISAQGRHIWVRVVGEVEFENGKPVALVGGFQDVTQRRQREEQLRTEEVRLRAIYDILPVGISITDPKGHIIDCNPASEKMLGISKAEHLARNYDGKEWVINREDGTTMAVEEFASVRALTQQAPVHDAVMQVITNQHSVWLSVSAMPVPHPDFGVVIAYVDVTQQKAQADALQASKDQADQASLFKSQFLANMSHEIRTPMNAILGMLQLLHATALQPRQLDYVEKTEGAAKSLLGLLNDILDFSKVEAGKMTLDPQPFQLDRLLRDLSVIFSASLGNKPVEVLFDIDPLVPRHLLGDSLRLQQILINLCGNAIKFTAQGEVVLRVHLEKLEGQAPDQRALLQFAVKDSGIGIAPENQQKIFAGFTQAEASTTRRFGGTGLGLSICRRLIEMMGGQLQLQSTVGQGSTFSFSVPLPLLEIVAERNCLPAPQQAEWYTPGFPVLVVDDNPIARELMTTMGTSMGWHVEAAESGDVALTRMTQRIQRGEPYRAVFVDWMMPGLDGWQTSERMRALNSANAGIDGQPVVFPLIMMVTAHGREMLAQQPDGVQALLDGYLVKPVTASMLFDALQNGIQPGVRQKNAPSSSHVTRRLHGMRLLLVEDNAINQQVAEELLSGQGAAIDIAENGLRGVEAVKASMTTGKPYDAVLMDMQMPVMDGIEATRQIRNQLGVKDLPIIAMTANAMASDREACLAAGMNDHVGKPFDLERLVGIVLQWAQPTFESELAGPTVPEAKGSALKPTASQLLNRVAALGRVGGNASLLDRLSLQFLAALDMHLQTYQQALDQNRREDAQRALHSIKGAAATIGAEALAEAAHVAEHACKAGQKVDLDTLNAIAGHTRQAMLESSIKPAVSFSPETTPDTIEVPADVSDQEREILQRILPLLEDSNMDALSIMEDLLTHGPSTRWLPLDQALQALEFDRACGIVRITLSKG